MFLPLVTLKASQTKKMLSLRSWKGLKEQEGGASPEPGEAAAMSNFRVTDSGTLRRRGGLQTVMSLILTYSPEESGETLTMSGLPAGDEGRAITLFPRLSCSEEGSLVLQGEGVSHVPGAGGHLGWYVRLSGEKVWKLTKETVSGDICTWLFAGMQAARQPAPSHPEVQAVWSGFAGGSEVICAVAGEHFWSLELREDGTWEKADGGAVSPGERCSLFPFQDRVYVLTGKEYYCWDGSHLSVTEGYRPLILAECVPSDGSGTELQGVNLLTSARRCRYSPDGTAEKFVLPESGVASIDYVLDRTTGEDPGGWSAVLPTEGRACVRFSAAPSAGTDTLEIGYSVEECGREEVTAMTCAELYNGSQDTRVFLYGDGSSRALYSGLDLEGTPRGDYFPALGTLSVGDSNTPLRCLQRHYDKLLAFKDASAWSIAYGTVETASGITEAGFTVTPIHRSCGSDVTGQMCMVENCPRTFDGGRLLEWRTASGYGSLNGDARNAHRVGDEVALSLRQHSESPLLFYDAAHHEFYCVRGSTAFVQNTANGAWYVYEDFAAACLIVYRGELYLGTGEGKLAHLCREGEDDDGTAVSCFWESGDLDLGDGSARKRTSRVWAGLLPLTGSSLTLKLITASGTVSAVLSAPDSPGMQRARLKGTKLSSCRLRLESATDVEVNAIDIEITYGRRS